MAQQAQAKETQEGLKPLMKEVQSRSEAAMDNIRDFSEQTADKAKAIAEDLVEEVKNVPALIRKHPVESVLIGVGVGLLGAWVVKKLID